MNRAVAASLAGMLLMGEPGRSGNKQQQIVSTKPETASHSHTNRLAREKSPYLLQHQHNPVDWYAWGDEAFERARKENKPIFLSIGYSTCHWCHVMERESFESEDIAKFLNEHFVSIKVDREERPDVDKIYMTFVQATTGSGGWPLNVFLTPDLKPFFGGTYFPPDNRYGRGSFMQVLKQVDNLWTSRRNDVTNSAEDIHSRLEAASDNSTATNVLLTAEVVRQAGSAFKQSYDPRHGGFGGAPKFPQPSQPQFLLRYAKRFNDEEAINMVLHTCDRMAAGGIHDQLGGGFARYSVDAEWLVPHFEKMLYDNAQLTQLYLDAYLISGEQRHADVARDILDYVLRDMTHPEGGFYSAEDADSEGHEGKFYCWTKQELSELLSPDELKVVLRFYGITENGNFVDHSHPSPLPNQNVLSIVRPELSAAEAKHLASAKRKMMTARAKRVRPHLDDKVLASWNGMMLGAMARAGIIFGEERYLNAAKKNCAFMHSKLWDEKSKSLYHRWRDGERDGVQLLEGYAFALNGVLDLYEATLDPKYLQFCLDLAGSMLKHFYDSENGGFWQSPADSKDLIMRVKEDYDGAEPSGNSAAILALQRLGKITEQRAFLEAAEKSLRSFSARLQQLPQAVPFMLQAFDFSLEEPFRAVVVADPSAAKPLLRSVHATYQPRKVVLGTEGPVEPFAKTLPSTNGPAVYICSGTACKPPSSDPAQIKELLR